MTNKVAFILMTSCLLMALLSWQPTVASSPCKGHSAAVRIGTKVIFFFGTKFLTFDMKTHRRLNSGYARDLFKGFPSGVPITAAYRAPKGKKDLILISNNVFYQARKGKIVGSPAPLKRLFGRNRKFAAGIDAAAVHAKVIYYFKECTINRKARSGARRLISIKKFNIPCDIDAAWEESGAVIVAKGPFVWRIDMVRQKANLHCFYCNPIVDLDIA